MRIPPSAIVMTLLCAVPFGLAIRDAKHDKHASHHDDFEDLDGVDEYRSEASAERARIEEMERQEMERAKKSERDRVARRVVGSEPATLGSLFDGVALGAPAGSFQPESVREELSRRSDVVNVDWDVSASRLEAVTVSLLGDDCDPLVAAVRAWGTGVDGRWTNPTAHQRAELDRVACSLRFERYVDVDAWIDRKGNPIVSLATIGQPAAKLHDSVQSLLTEDLETDESFTWRDTGLAGAMGDTRITAFKKNGKIAALNVIFHVDATTLDALEARLTKLLGAPPAQSNEDETGALVWKGKLPVTLSTGDVSSLTIGTIPE